jgi:hypothetical protein
MSHDNAAERRPEAPGRHGGEAQPAVPRPVADHGARKQTEATDPLELKGAVVPGNVDYLARCFIEEFAFMGRDGAAILELFRDPCYVAVHAIYRRRGEEAVRRLIDEVLAECGVLKVTVQTPRHRRPRKLVQIEAPGSAAREDR